MPYVIRWPHKRALALAVSGFALLVAAQPAAASSTSTDCPIAPSASQVFASLGDNASYFAVPGGTFEGATTDWSLNEASIVGGNAPFQVAGSADAQSLQIAPSGSAVSPTVCVSAKTPTWRFFARAADSTGKLRLAVQLANTGGNTVTIPIGTLKGASYTSWTVTPALLLGKVLPPGLSIPLHLVFTADSKGSAWSLDDVFVDPYVRG